MKQKSIFCLAAALVIMFTLCGTALASNDKLPEGLKEINGVSSASEPGCTLTVGMSTDPRLAYAPVTVVVAITNAYIVDSEKLVPAIKRFAGARSIVLIDEYAIDYLQHRYEIQKIENGIEQAKNEQRVVYVKFDNILTRPSEVYHA